MLAETSTAIKSGLGTSMLSRTGQETIAMNKVFKGKESNVNEYTKNFGKGVKFNRIPGQTVDADGHQLGEDGQPIHGKEGGKKVMAFQGLD